jgi:ubiquinone/menaquinone biosynthesis C-methylase UbiE
MSEYFETAAIEWDNDPNRVQMARTIADAMLRALHPTGTETVMDYGTGTGLIALQIRPHVKRVLAVDSAEKMLAVLSQKISDAGITEIEPRKWDIMENIGDMPQCDLIVSSMTLHHVPNTALAARVFFSLLRSGGSIAIADLDTENGGFHDKPGIAEHDGFNRKALAATFAGAGFSEIRFDEAATIVKRSSRTNNPRRFSIILMTAVRG